MSGKNNISNAEKDRLNNAIIQALQEHKSSRNSDLQQAQDLINKAQTVAVYTFGGMLALPSIQLYIAIAGILLILNNAIGTFNKYKARVQTRLRADVLRYWQFNSLYKEIANFDGVSHNIKIKNVKFWSLIACKGSIAFTYTGFIIVIFGAAYFDVPLLAKANEVIKVLESTVC